MKTVGCSVRDVKVGNFVGCYFYANRVEALRQFTDVVSNPQSSLFKFPEDYQIFCVGEFDTETGVLVPCSGGPEFMCNVTDLKK